jgi:hypothetical protein
MAHHEKTGNDFKTKFAVIFALLFFFGVTVAANQYFVGNEEAGESVEHAASGDDEADTASHDDSGAQDKHKTSGRKRH